MNYKVDLQKLEEIMIAHISNPRNLPENLAELVRIGEPVECEDIKDELVENIFTNLILVTLIVGCYSFKNYAIKVKRYFNDLESDGIIEPTFEELIIFFSQVVCYHVSKFIPVELNLVNLLNL